MRLILSLALLFVFQLLSCTCLSVATPRRVYGVPSWTSDDWNWGSAVGDAHDCAVTCRRVMSRQELRQSFVDDLLTTTDCPENFEEVKLVLALAWQTYQVYPTVLRHMAEAERYERGTDEACMRLFVHDMRDEFATLHPSAEQQQQMNAIVVENDDSAQPMSLEDLERARRQCSGLVLSCMGFVEKGL
jgi:hypothetical protein